MYDLFISYATNDGLALAGGVVADLEERYMLETYVADEKNRAGIIIDDKVREAISQSKRILILFTPAAISSEWVLGEVALALEMNKELIICRRRDVQRQSLPIRLVEKEHITFEKLEDLLNRLHKIEWGIPLIIPAGGRSGGLYPLNIGMPKLLLPVGNKPILHQIVNNLDSRAFSKIIILTRAFSEMIEYYASLIKADIPIKCMRTPAPMLPMALKEMALKTTFVIHYSDIIIEGNFNWMKFLAHHKHNENHHGVIGTLMASDKYKLPVGRIRMGNQQLLQDFTEKPESIQAVGYTINMAISIFEPEFLDSIDDGDSSLYGDSLRRAMDDGKQFCIYSHDKWRHIQTLSDWYEVQKDHFKDDEDYFLTDVTSRD